MGDLIARIVARLLCALLFPVTQRCCDMPAVVSPRPRRIPERMSPYAREATEIANQPINDRTNLVRPYVTVPVRKLTDDGLQRLVQAERRWVLDMALRGIDVGPALIHGVHVQPGARTLRVAVGA